MPWDNNNYPNTLKNFTPEVRDKIIEIANTLMEKEKFNEERALRIAIDTAKEWAENRHIPIRENDNEK